MQRLVQQDANGECCGCRTNCDPCTPPDNSAVSFSCVSRQGNGNLRGWSKFQNFNSGDWNTRKYTVVNYSASPGSWTRDIGYSSLGCVNPTGLAAVWTLDLTSASWNVSTNSISGTGRISSSGCPGEIYTVNLANPFPTYTGFGVVQTYTDGPLSDTSYKRHVAQIVTGCQNGTNSCSTLSNLFDSVGWDIFSVISVPDTVFAALGRGSPTVAANCRTNAGTIANTSAGSSSQIAITGPRAVRTTFACTGLVDGQDYRITWVETKYSPGTSTVLSTTTYTHDFTASGTTYSRDYDNTVDATGDYEVTSASIDPI